LAVNKLLHDSIEREIKGTDYIYCKEDRQTLDIMFSEINSVFGTDMHYLAEIAACDIHGSGEILSKYFDRFRSESVRGYIIPQLVADRITDCADVVLQAYYQFKNSNEYIAKPGEPSPAHIYTRYDNAFRQLKPKKLKRALLLLASYPRDVFYLPFTMRMLASWKIPSMEELLYLYLDSDHITAESVGLSSDWQNTYPSLPTIKRELKFFAIDGLKYYPSAHSIEQISQLQADPDKDIRIAAQKTMRHLERAKYISE